MMIFASACNEEINQEQTMQEPEQEKSLKVAVLTGEGFQDQEVYMPLGYLANRNVKTVTVGEAKGSVKAYNNDFTVMIEKTVDEVSVDEFDALLIPGGKAPSSLRENEKIVAFAKEFLESGKPVAAICHGPQILIRAGVMEGRKSTAYKTVREELTEAGAGFQDTSLVVDGNLITSRNPGDLPVFARKLYEKLK